MELNQHKHDLEHFEAPNMENDFGRLNEKQIMKQIEFVNRANAAYEFCRRNGFPPGYVESIKINQELYKENAAGTINMEDLYALDSAIGETIWDSDTFSKMGIPTSTMSKPRWLDKNYLVQSEQWPRFTKDYRNPVFVALKESSEFAKGIGLHMGVSIPFTEIKESAGALWGPRAIMTQEVAAKMGIMKSRRGFLGSSCQGAYDDGGGTAASFAVEGLFNATNKQTFECGAAGDDDVTAAGDIEIDIRVALTDLKQVYQPGKYYIVSTSGYASEPFLHRQTYTDTLDWSRCKEILDIVSNLQRSNQWGGWWVTEQLYASTPAAANQQVMVFKASPQLIQRMYVYPQQTLSMKNKLYEGDIQENMIFGDIIKVKKVDTTVNANPITIAADVTATTTGFIPEGTRIL